MAQILHAWELGGGYGHLQRIFAVADELASLGHANSLVLRDTASAVRLAQGTGYPIQQAPLLPPARSGSPMAINYADLLRLCGYTGSSELAGVIQCWVRMFEDVSPDLIILDHAPTACLAACVVGLPAVLIQNGFGIPPARSHFPSIQPWRSISQSELRAADHRILGVVNGALGLLGRPTLDRLTDLSDGFPALLCTLPEFDHYGPRQGAPYIGPVLASGGAFHAAWERAPGPRAFAYFNRLGGAARRVVDALAMMGLPTLLHVGDRSLDASAPATCGGLFWSAEPVDMRRASLHADLVACNGGHGTVCSAVLAATPVLAVPTDVEKAVMGFRLASQGLGGNVEPNMTMDAARATIERLLTVPGYRSRAAKVRDRYRRAPFADPALKVAKFCHDMLSGSL